MRFLIATLLVVAAHFGMGALVAPSIDEKSWLAPLATDSSSWVPGLGHPGAVASGLGLLAVACFGLALLGVFGWWVRTGWVRPATMIGLASVLTAYTLYFTLPALIPLCLSAVALYAVLTRRATLVTVHPRNETSIQRAPRA